MPSTEQNLPYYRDALKILISASLVFLSTHGIAADGNTTRPGYNTHRQRIHYAKNHRTLVTTIRVATKIHTLTVGHSSSPYSSIQGLRDSGQSLAIGTKVNAYEIKRINSLDWFYVTAGAQSGWIKKIDTAQH